MNSQPGWTDWWRLEETDRIKDNIRTEPTESHTMRHSSLVKKSRVSHNFITKIKPAQELEVQQIMDNFNCHYNNVVEAVDLYNLDIEECMTV